MRRPVLPADLHRICCRLIEQQDRTPETVPSRLGSVGTVLIAIEEQQVDSCIVDEEYLLVYHVGQPWYSYHTVVEELMVLNLTDTPGNFSGVTDALEEIAEEYHAKAIITGGAWSPQGKALSRLYQRQGFADCSHHTHIRWR